jgi:protein-tyrosine phosphatase
MTTPFVDIHCHILPGIDDGARDWDESLAMARLASADGTATIIATPHQLGSYGGNHGDTIRHRVAELSERLAIAGISLRVLPGADVRVDAQLVEQILSGEVPTLGDHGRHVLLELPHELYIPLESIVERLARHNIVAILSHPERNEGILRRPDVLEPLVSAGCLLQVTAGSLCGTFGESCRRLAESLVVGGLVHFVASDGHGAKARRPLMRRAYERLCELVGIEMAFVYCCHHPALVAAGHSVPIHSGIARHPRRNLWQKLSAA